MLIKGNLSTVLFESVDKATFINNHSNKFILKKIIQNV